MNDDLLGDEIIEGNSDVIEEMAKEREKSGRPFDASMLRNLASQGIRLDQGWRLENVTCYIPWEAHYRTLRDYTRGADLFRYIDQSREDAFIKLEGQGLQHIPFSRSSFKGYLGGVKFRKFVLGFNSEINILLPLLMNGEHYDNRLAINVDHSYKENTLSEFQHLTLKAISYSERSAGGSRRNFFAGYNNLNYRLSMQNGGYVVFKTDRNRRLLLPLSLDGVKHQTSNFVSPDNVEGRDFPIQLDFNDVIGLNLFDIHGRASVLKLIPTGGEFLVHSKDGKIIKRFIVSPIHPRFLTVYHCKQQSHDGPRVYEDVHIIEAKDWEDYIRTQIGI